MRLIGSNKDKNDCAVVGVYNVLALLGRPKSYGIVKLSAKFLFGYRRKRGTPIRNIGNMLAWHDLGGKEIVGMTLDQVEEKVSCGQPMPFVYFCRKSEMGHMVTLVKRGTRVKVINPPVWGKTWKRLKRAIRENELGFSVWEINQ